MPLIEDALARQAARPEPRRIDYARMNAVYPKQKAALTRAVNARKAIPDERDIKAGPGYVDRLDAADTARVRATEKIAAVCKAAITEWNAIGAWPDDWHRWQNALDDALGWNQHIDLRDL